MTFNIRFMPAVKTDAAKLNREQDRLIQRFLIRARECADPTRVPFEDVIACNGNLTGWFRFKPSIEMRADCGCDIRLVFRVQANEIIVLAVGARSDIYAQANQRLGMAYNAWDPAANR